MTRGYTTRTISQGIDWMTIALFLVIAIFGWLNIYGAGYTFEQTSIFDLSNRAGKQLLWIGLSCFFAVVVLFIDSRAYQSLAYLFYGVWLLVLLVTPLLAHDTKGSLSWIDVGPLKFQPAELSKLITALALAAYMGRYEYRLRSWRDLVVPVILLLVPMFIIMVFQKETGSALVYASFLLMFYRMGMSGYVITGGLVFVLLFVLTIRFEPAVLPLGTGNAGTLLCALTLLAVLVGFACYYKKDPWLRRTLLIAIPAVFGVALIVNIFTPVNFSIVALSLVVAATVFMAVMSVRQQQYRYLLVAGYVVLALIFSQACSIVFQKVLQPHQRTRIEVLLGLKDDPTGAGYNVNQSLIAIGSGQFSGKGYLQGTQTKLKFVPEQDTDFIFCTVGEEWGFLGSAGLLCVYMWLLIHLIRIAERQREWFALIYAYCVVGILFFHLTINIGMVLGLLPVIGIPLPFFSYGGSSMISFTLLLAILLRMDAERLNKMQ